LANAERKYKYVKKRIFFSEKTNTPYIKGTERVLYPRGTDLGGEVHLIALISALALVRSAHRNPQNLAEV
jgi:hypothetical protein